MVLYTPATFSFTTVWISSLGNPALNTPSIYIFNPGVFLTGILLLLHFLDLFNSLSLKPIIVNWIFRFFLLIGAFGFAFIAIFTDNIQPIHDIMAAIAFGGLGLGYVILDGFFLFKGMQLRKKDTKLWIPIMLSTLPVMGFLICAVGVFISGGINYKANSDWIIIWEWLAFAALAINILWGNIGKELLKDFEKN
jgi:hypothetical protein